ncbi:MAG: hypothetical protein II711_04260 [Clostridia bacterium]|nr:hypothetical protein [Clostridia bacterium]
MDTALHISGDFEQSGDEVLTVSGIQEIRQQVYIMLSAHKGAFIYDRELGSDIGKVDLSSENCIEEVEACARAALADVEGAEVVGVTIDDGAVWVSVVVQDTVFEVQVRNTEE